MACCSRVVWRRGGGKSRKTDESSQGNRDAGSDRTSRGERSNRRHGGSSRYYFQDQLALLIPIHSGERKTTDWARVTQDK